MKPMYDLDFMKDLKEVKPALAKVIEDHLPGDFSNWEEENSTWNGDVKTIDGTRPDPRTDSCAFEIYFASERPEDRLLFMDLKADAEALNRLAELLQDAAEAISRLSIVAWTSLDEAASQRLRDSYEPPRTDRRSAVAELLLINQAIQFGVNAAVAKLEPIRDDPDRSNRRAAAVAKACQKVYEARTGKPAPRSALDAPIKKSADAEPALFVRFTKAVFYVLGINSNVASALDRLKKLEEAAEKNAPTSE